MAKKCKTSEDILTAMQIAYENNTPPREIARKYGKTSQQMNNIIYTHGWKKLKDESNKRKIERLRQQQTEESMAEIGELTRLARQAIKDVLMDPDARYSDKLSAAKAVFDINGDKVQTNKVEGAIKSTTEYIPPTEWKEINQHIVDFLKN